MYKEVNFIEAVEAFMNGEIVEYLSIDGTWYRLIGDSSLHDYKNHWLDKKLRIKQKPKVWNGLEFYPPLQEFSDCENWFVDFYSSKVYQICVNSKFVWRGSLEQGLIHPTKEAAEMHLKVLQKFQREVITEDCQVIKV